MVYCDFTYYTNTYLGNQITSQNFPRLALRASNFIDQITFNRAASETDLSIVDKIKMATCAIAEEIQLVEADGGIDGISSESVGGYSVSYNSNATKQLSKDQRYLEAAELYLSNTGLLFAGFADGEYGSE